MATPENEHELLAIARSTTAAGLGRALAAWLHRNADPEDIDAHHPPVSALVHDSAGDPADATNRRRHPNRRQKRLLRARDKRCVDCGRADLPEFDHVPAYLATGHTTTGELRLRCAPCHQRRHGN